MASGFQLTLGQLSDLVFSKTHMSKESIALLHGLISALLKRLNCGNEKIAVKGIDAKGLRKLMAQQTRLSSSFNVGNVKVLEASEQHLEKLEERSQHFGSRLKTHLDEIIKQRTISYNFSLVDWYGKDGDTHMKQYEMSCSPKYEIAYNLVNDTGFMKKVLRRVTAPAAERFYILETRVLKLSKTFDAFITTIKSDYENLVGIRELSMKMQKLHRNVDEERTLFLDTMEELQEIIDEKFDKFQVPALKKYCKDRIDAIDEKLKSVMTIKSCPAPGDIVIPNVQCLLCGRIVCADKDAQRFGLAQETLPRRKTRTHLKRSLCKCQPKSLPEFAVSWEYIAPQLSNIAALSKRIPHKPCAESRNELIQGTNGKLYRRG